MTRIAIVGGTGPEGRGLALRLAMAGREVVIGSRDPARAASASAELREGREGLAISGAANADAASAADAVLLSVPFDGLRSTAEALRSELAGRLVVSIVAPMEFAGGRMRAVSVPEGSAGELARDLLPDSRVASAFQNLSARDLLRADRPLEGDVAVCADDEAARRETIALADAMPALRGVDAGPLANSRYVEELTALLVNVNRIHKAHSTIRFVGL